MDTAFRARAEAELEKRKLTGNFRSLSVYPDLVDFYSNDYLGLASSETLNQAIKTSTYFNENGVLNGSRGSRLLAGNNSCVMNLEADIARFYGAPAALIFNSGYDANLSFFSSIPRRGDTVIHDELIHASVIDGIRLSFAKRLSFKHNDTNSLIQLLEKTSGTIFIAVESLYSMDGDFSPIKRIAEIALEFGATLIIDEAHTTGIMGTGGRGMCNKLGLNDIDIVRLHTFGKAGGVHGAAFVISTWLKAYLVNFARPFIYSTSLPPHALSGISKSLTFMEQAEQERLNLKVNIALYLKEMANHFLKAGHLESPIQTISIQGNERCTQVAARMRLNGFHVRSIVSPSVPEGDEKLRICLHSYNTLDEIKSLVMNLAESMKDIK